MRFIKRLCRKVIWLLGSIFNSLVEVDYEKVVLNNFNGQGYSCNPKYIAEALERLYPGRYRLVLLAQGAKVDCPSYIKSVPIRSLRALYELSTARFLISNCRFDRFVPKHKHQIYLQAWHASLGPKKVESDVVETLSPEYVACAKSDASCTDIMFANNDLYTSIYRSSFWYDGPIIRCGVPRNKPFLCGDDNLAQGIKERIGVPAESKLCIYVPTFRDNLTMDAYRFDYSKCVCELENRFGAPFVFAYRLHPVLARADRPEFMKDYLDLTDYPDVQELLCAADVLITDYSSCLEDFALTGRPGFAYVPDLDYINQARGFYYPLKSRPFPISTSETELFESIASFDQGAFDEAVARFFEMVGYRDDGYGDEAIASILEKLSTVGSTVDDVVSQTEKG